MSLGSDPFPNGRSNPFPRPNAAARNGIPAIHSRLSACSLQCTLHASEFTNRLSCRRIDPFPSVPVSVPKAGTDLDPIRSPLLRGTDGDQIQGVGLDAFKKCWERTGPALAPHPIKPDHEPHAPLDRHPVAHTGRLRLFGVIVAVRDARLVWTHSRAAERRHVLRRAPEDPCSDDGPTGGELRAAVLPMCGVRQSVLQSMRPDRRVRRRDSVRRRLLLPLTPLASDPAA